MASTASTILRLELMASGENDGTWGTKVNTNLGILESALTGTTSIATTGGTTTLTNVDYVNDQAKKLCLDVTGALVSNATIVIPNAAKSYKVFNRTSGAFTLSIKTASGSAIEITQSTAAEVYCDGSNVIRFITPMVNFSTGAPATATGAAASSVGVTPTGNLVSTNAQAALAELQGDVDALNALLLSSYQPLDADLTTIAGLAKTDGGFLVGNGTNWVVETLDTARTSLGVGTGDSPQFAAINLGNASDTTLTRASAGRVAAEGVTLVGTSTTDTLTNKTINLASNTLTGTVAEFNAALSGDNFATLTGTETLTNKTISGGAISGALVRMTEQATTSGSTFDFTIPSGVKRITIMFSAVAWTGTCLVQLGDAGGVETTSYTSLSVVTFTGNSVGGQSSTSGFVISAQTAASGTMTLSNLSGNVWVSAHCTFGSTVTAMHGGGTKTLSDTLTTVRLTATSFSAGSVNVIYE